MAVTDNMDFLSKTDERNKLFMNDIKELVKEIISITTSNLPNDRKARLINRSIDRVAYSHGTSTDYIQNEIDNFKRLESYNNLQSDKHSSNIDFLIQNLLLDKRYLISQREQWVVTYQISERWELKQEALSYMDNLDNSITQISEKIDTLFEKNNN